MFLWTQGTLGGWSCTALQTQRLRFNTLSVAAAADFMSRFML